MIIKGKVRNSGNSIPVSILASMGSGLEMPYVNAIPDPESANEYTVPELPRDRFIYSLNSSSF